MDPACVTDRTSLVGLRPLVGRRPEDWHMLLFEGAQPPRNPPDEGASVADVLRSGVVSSLAPRHRDDAGRLRRARAAASRLVLAVGDRPMRDVDNAFVERLRVELTDATNPKLERPLAASTTSRTLAVLREAARAWAAGCRLPSQIDAHPRGPSRRMGDRRDRPVPSLYEIADLLSVADVPLRAAVGLAAGGGLGEGEIVELRRFQLRSGERRVALYATKVGRPRDTRCVRYAWLPPWAMDLLAALHPGLRTMPAGAWLFPSPTRGYGPSASLQPALTRACVDAFGADGPRYTFGDLRRSWQAVCRAEGLPRAVVRQSWARWEEPGRPPSALAPGVLRFQRMACEWRVLGDGPGRALMDPAPVPRQAPKGTGPWEAEPLGAARPPELPPSCGV